MQATFVSRIVQEIERHSFDATHLSIIVPSERMIRYLQIEIAKNGKRVQLLPKIQTIDSWLQSLVSEAVLHPNLALFELYEIYAKNPIPGDVISFDTFMEWGQTLLSDFDEIDRHLVNASQLFKNLRDVKEIESWSFEEGRTLTPGQEKYMAFWDKLGPYYLEFSKKLEKIDAITKGKIYRKVAEFPDLIFQKDKKAQFVFAGFNALSLSEKTIFRNLNTMGRALILCDGDQYYVNDKWHEAGVFIRDLNQFLGTKQLPFLNDSLATKEINFQLVECAQSTGQAKVIGSELAKLTQEELQKTLVLLADEKQLQSLLQNLPKSIQKANITLGLPLRYTSLKSWIEILFRIQEGFHRKAENLVYHKDIIQLFRHPFLQGMLNEKQKAECEQLESEIIRMNQHYLTIKYVQGRLVESWMIFEKIVQAWKNDWSLALHLFAQIASQIDHLLDETYHLEKAGLRIFEREMIPLRNLFKGKIPKMELSSFKKLFQQCWNRGKLAYFGSATDGLQIMGLLETRGLDFERVFVLGLNEEAMPPSNQISTVIPMDLRRFFQLPSPKDKQALFAHHFYRLLHCAKEVFITYAVNESGIGATEASRYVQQLQLEYVKDNPNAQISIASYLVDSNEIDTELIVLKTPQILARLKEMCEKGISFSQLNTFLTCPLNFYYKYVLQFGEEEKVEETIELNTLGTITHYALELAYQPYLVENLPKSEWKKYQITADVLKEMKRNVNVYVDKAFQEKYAKDLNTTHSGVNHLQYQIITHYCIDFFANQEKLVSENQEFPHYVISLEKKFETKLSIHGIDFEVKLTGIIDRIDWCLGKERILDYKTGNVSESEVIIGGKNTSVETSLEKIRNGDKKYLLQLMIYAILYERNEGKFIQQNGIYSFKNKANSPMYLSVYNDQALDILKEANQIVSEIISDLLNPNIPFEHTKKSKNYCLYCT